MNRSRSRFTLISFQTFVVVLVLLFCSVYTGLALPMNAAPFNNILLLDGVDDYASAPDHASLDLGTGAGEDFTIEMFFYVPDLTNTGTDHLVVKQSAYGLYILYSDTIQDRFIFRINFGPLTGDYVYIFYNVDLTPGWHHVAAVYDNEFTDSEDLLALYLDGNQVKTGGGFDTTPGVYNSTSPLNIGAATGINSFNGWLEEVRFSNVVRYNGPYTVPTSPFTNDANTRALWHFDEAGGATTFSDSSGNGNTLSGLNGAKTGQQVIAPRTISGNTGLGGATLSFMDGLPKTVIADGSGNYSILVPSGWSGKVTVTKAGYTFTPPNRTYSNLQSDLTNQNYTAQVHAIYADATGVFRPINGLLYLKNKNDTGFADYALNYGLPGDYPVVGDWDGDGTITIGIYRGNTFYLRNENTLGFATTVFDFGQPGDQPIAGDWDGDGIDTIGVFRPSNGQFLLRNSNEAGSAEMSFYLGNVGDVGIAGDWNGDGLDTTGVFRPSNGVIFMKNSNDTGIADIALNYGLPGDQPVMGDWNNGGTDTIGIYRSGTFYLRNENTNGFAEIIFGLGNPGDMPIAGDWDGLP